MDLDDVFKKMVQTVFLNCPSLADTGRPMAGLSHLAPAEGLLATLARELASLATSGWILCKEKIRHTGGFCVGKKPEHYI